MGRLARWVDDPVLFAKVKKEEWPWQQERSFDTSLCPRLFTTCTSKDLKSVSNSVELSVKNVNISSSNEERDITGARTGSGVER